MSRGLDCLWLLNGEGQGCRARDRRAARASYTLPTQTVSESGQLAETKAEVIWHSCLTHLGDLAYCFSANLGVESRDFNTMAMMDIRF
jgi:hypothetical protein